MAIRRLLGTLCGVAVAVVGLHAVVGAQQEGRTARTAAGVLVDATDETPQYWFVQLSSAPTIDGTSETTLKNERAAFRTRAAKAGVRFTERFAFSTLFNGFSIRMDRSQLNRLAQVPGVKAVYPVIEIQAPEDPSPDPVTDLYTALKMSGAYNAQNTLGLTGRGVKVGIIDTGVDYDHPDLGGSGTTDGSSTFPTKRVITGYDFVGDDFKGSSSTPVPDSDPDDCNGHGTHVAGIVGANGSLFKGVAPGVKYGAYRVFGCSGSTTADIMIAAMERAHRDGMNVVNMSIGSTYQWPEYPSAAAATRLVNHGVVVVASIGNDGEKSMAAVGAPGVGAKVIGVASYDNTHVRLPYFTVEDVKYGYNTATGSGPVPTDGSVEMVRTGTTTTGNDACSAASVAGVSGKVALIRRGTCSFAIKAGFAQAAGAVAVVLYNNAAGFLNPTVAGGGITIPVVAITQADGAALNALMDAGSTVTMTWTDQEESFVNPAGGLISSFSSYGLAPDLSLKPDLGAPGGNISSTYPLESGGYAVMSGTSMSSPHVAGTVALYLQAHPNASVQQIRSILQNTAVPALWSGNPSLGYLDLVARQGAGMVQIDKAVTAPVRIEPGKLSLGEGAAGDQVRTLLLKNESGKSITYDLTYVNGLSGANKTSMTAYTTGTFYDVGIYGGNAKVTFPATSVTVPSFGSRTVTATITPATGPAKGYYGGYIVFTPRDGGTVLRVPYAGFVGDYQSIEVLTGTANGFPWLSKLNGSSYYHMTEDGTTYTMAGSDVPYFLVHFDYQSRLVLMEVFDAQTGKYWQRALQLDHFGRNSATGYYALSFDGTTTNAAGTRTFTVPNGSYVMRLSVLKALGDPNNTDDWETWTSPVFKIAR